jgi:hypothetical protein
MEGTLTSAPVYAGDPDREGAVEFRYSAASSGGGGLGVPGPGKEELAA